MLRNNGLSLALLVVFMLFWLGQAIAGWSVFNDDQIDHGRPVLGFAAYLASPHFWESTAENWESEFLQMAAYVALTAVLFQRGSAESKNPDKPHPTDRPIPANLPPDAPWALRKGGRLIRWLYSYSLSLAFVILFLGSLIAHALSGYAMHNEEQLAHGATPDTMMDYLTGAQFWFQALQNWQSEFLAVFAIAVLSIFLRHKGSPESKPLDMPNRDNPE